MATASSATRVVVFGASGFIGRHVLAAMDARPGPAVTGITHAEADLADADAVARVLRRGDIVVNAAGFADPADRSAEALVRLRRANVEGVETLAAACRDTGVEQLIHVSSVAAMGRLEGTGIDESARGPLGSPYAASKREGEAILARHASDLPITILRPTSAFGEGRGLAVPLCRAARLPLVPLPGGGHALIPYTYVGNIAHAITLTVGHMPCFGRTFIIGDMQSYPLRDIVLALAAGMGKRPRFLPVPYPLARVAARVGQRVAAARGRPPLIDATRLHTMTTSVSYSIDAFIEATGYQPPIDLADAGRRIARWYLAARHH